VERSLLNRLEFFKEMRKSFRDTLKAIYMPLIEEDLDKLEKVTEHVLELKWYSLGYIWSFTSKIEYRYINGIPVIIVMEGESVQVFSGICPACSNLFVVSTLYSTSKCMKCEREYDFKSKNGDLILEELLMKSEKDELFVGFQKR